MSFSEQLLQIDGNLLIGIQCILNADWLTPIMRGLTFLAEVGWFWIAIGLVLLVRKNTRRIGIIYLVSLTVSFLLCNGVFKLSIDRARPWEVFDGVRMLNPDPGDSSFPSGHSAASMGSAWALWLTTRGSNVAHKWAWAAVVLALLIALSRVYLGMHFPSDVIAGILIGMICATFVYTIFKKYVYKNDTINAVKRFNGR